MMRDPAKRAKPFGLVVIIADRLSDLVRKGEVTPRYYNPCDLFDEVHLLLTNDDKPDASKVQPMVGRARLSIRNVPPPDRLFYKSLGWMPSLMRPWSDRVVALIREIGPQLIRTHNNFLEGHLAVEAKRALNVPFVTSLHGVWDRDSTQPDLRKEAVIRFFRGKIERRTLRNADAVIAVYKPVLRYAREFGARDTRLIYNAVSGGIVPKRSYAMSRPPRLITVNRQTTEKNPENIIRAIADLDCTYTLIGDGPLQQRLRAVAKECGVVSRVDFIKAMPNEELVRRLPEYDIVVSHCDYWGISKGVIEAALAGMPIVLNTHPVAPIPDCEGNWLALCDNTVVGYREAIKRLIDNEAARKGLGRAARSHAAENFEPVAMESAVGDLYTEIVARYSDTPRGIARRPKNLRQ